MGETVRLTNSSTGGPVFVYVKDGRIVRMTPMDLDDAVDAPSWKIEARGKTFAPPRKTTYSVYTAGFKSMIYSDRRIKTPMKRVDFDPNGERNPQNRGISGYEPISWDEATDLVVSEINRVKREAGPAAILSSPSSHHMWGNVGYRHSTYFRFMNMMGFTYADHNPDSWEGWHWGGMHMWGFSWRLGNPEQYDLLEDGLQNAEMIVFWSADPETNTGIYAAHESTIRRAWLKELGVKMVFIDPFYNHTAGLIGDKWFSPKIGTDHALSFAIAYTWLTEGTYDKEYVDTHSVGFDTMKAYVLGEVDGIAKTPKWASAKCGVPPWTIKALARDWAKKAVTIGHYFAGGMARGPYSTEPARLEVVLLGLQGLGKPGVHQAQIAYTGMPKNVITGGADHMGPFANLTAHPAGERLLKPHKGTPTAWGKQMVPKTLIEDAIKNGKVEFWGTGGHEEPTSNQYQRYTYPIAKEDGGTEFHMMLSLIHI